LAANIVLDLHIAFSPDGKWLVSGNFGSPSKEIWDAAKGEKLCTLPAGSGLSVSFSPDGRWLAASVFTSPTTTGLLTRIWLWKTDDIKALIRKEGAK
jgi:WD40 repeat protein